MKRPVRAGLFFAVVAWLAGCPVGCPKGNPQTIYEGPPEEVKLEKTGKCTYRATPPLGHPFPHDPGGTKTGAYFVVMDNDIASPTKDVAYDPVTGIFTILEPWCAGGVGRFQVTWHPLLRTVNE